MNHESQIETKRRKHDWCLWLRQGLIKNEGDDWRFKDNILRQARLDAIDKGETDDEILWCCLSIGEEFVHFLDIQMVNPFTQLPTGRGKRATPELHKVIWRPTASQALGLQKIPLPRRFGTLFGQTL